VRLWEVVSGRLLASLHGHTGVVRGVALSGDGHLVASGGDDGTVRLWEVGSGRLLATLQGHTGWVWGVALSGDGRLLASGSEDGTVRLWEVGSGACLRPLRSDRRYERLNISGLTGVSEAQRAALLALGALEGETAPDAAAAAVQVSSPQAPTPAILWVSPPEPELLPPAPARPPTNLRAARTTFVGRSTDLTMLSQALDPAVPGSTRLLTLTGVAGGGKTRLALQVAESARDVYHDGVWLVELSPLPGSAGADLTPVVAATLAALNLHEQAGQEPLDMLIASLRSRRLLLVLDNCEHVIAAVAGLAARLLDSCPALRLLATSQQALGQVGETVWPVAPLAVPPQPTDALSADALHLLEQSEAVQLFLQRAQVAQPGFALHAGTAAGVVTICRRLDGLPLAIELAAARLNVLTVDDLLTRLEDRFRLLGRGGRTAADRHHALQATMDWSYLLLDPAEQALLRRLAVFAGGWDLPAAEAVCAGEEVAAEAVLALLDELLDRSLVYVQETDGVPRYGLLETVRHYGLQHLERAGEMAAVRDRHLNWCVTLAEQAAPALLGREQVAWLGRLEVEHDNLRAALQWALDRGHGALGLRLAARLWMFWLRRRHQREGRHWLAAFLARAPNDDDATSIALRASALDGAAWLAEDGQEFAQAAALFAQGGALRLALGQDERTNGLLINAAMEARVKGDYARATILLEESLARHRAQGNREGILVGGLGLSLSRLALVLAEQGEHARATALYEECLALVRGMGDREGVGITLLGLGDIARDQGDAARTRTYCEECLALFRDLGYQWAIGFSLNNLALAAYLDGDLALAASRAEESEALFRNPESGPALAEVLVTVGRVRGALGELAAARASLTEALTLAWAKGPHWVVAAALEEIGVQTVRQGDGADGVQFLAVVAALREVMGVPIRPADRREVEDALAAGRTSLGRLPFEEAWGSGQGLPVEQVVARLVAGPQDGQASPDRGEKSERTGLTDTEAPR
jgi:non-specific serine/threonine protein kinase